MTGSAEPGIADGGPAAVPQRAQRRNYVAAVRAAVLVALLAVALSTPGFLSQPSMLSLLTTVSFIGCVAVGMTLITISGNIMSFSLGALTGATAMIFILAVNWGGFACGLAAALAFAGLANALQGFLIGWLRANPIIVSIAALALIYGVAEAFAAHGTIYAAAGTSYAGFKGKIAGLPVEFVVLLAITALAQFILSFTVFGRHLFLIGASFRAAETVGVRTWRAITGAYLWAGLFTAPAGIMLAMRYDAASMNYGVGYEYDAIAAVLVGGTVIKGGEGSAVRTLAGAIIIGVIQVVLVLQGLRSEWQYLIAGLIVLGVIALQTQGTRGLTAMKLFSRDDPHVRPLLILAGCILGLALIDAREVLTAATAASAFETFATIGLVALGLGLTMMIREFDLSVVGMYSLAGCIAVVMGGDNAWLGLACALAAGVLGGLAQGFIIVRLRLGSVGVTLGGLLVFAGIAYVVTENRALPYDNMAVALYLSAPVGGVFSVRSLVAIAIFLAAALVIGFTRYGRDIIAIGSDRRAAMTAGVDVDGLIVGIFGFSGFCAALSGALLSYSLASASPSGLSDVIVPAAAAAILGGVSLAGGTGRPLGIAMGVLSLAVLRAGFNAIGAPPYVNEIAMGAILLIVAALDGAYLARRLSWLRRPH